MSDNCHSISRIVQPAELSALAVSPFRHPPFAYMARIHWLIVIRTRTGGFPGSVCVTSE
jgi:hypothetical protein